MPILVITTGGTIGAVAHDKLQNPDRIQIMPPAGVDTVRDALADQFANIATRYIAFEPRDSNLIDDAYRGRLAALIGQAPETHILITHGTDTILQTAEFLFHRRIRKAIILTGALVPLACGAESDGYMNLDFSLAQLAQGKTDDGVAIVLCDYLTPETRQGWAPRLYPFGPRLYEKYYDPQDARRSRLIQRA